MIPPEVEAEILRLAHAEKWPIGTIAAQLNVHHDVVERVLAAEGLPRVGSIRPRMIDEFLPFIQATWKKYPKLPATRLYMMCRDRGYAGQPDYFRQCVAPYRPRPRAEAFLRLSTLPGEQGQVDWGHFGKIVIGTATWGLMAFVLVLAWSRAIFLRFFLGQKTENFLRGHQGAFECWEGVPRVLLYDNLKSAVLERIGDAIRFNPLLLSFSSHYRYEPRPVGIRRGNEKPRVERAIRYIRSGFFLARRWRDLDDLNRQALAWCLGEAMERPWPQDRSKKVGEVFKEEREKLLPLPETPFPTDERCEVRVGKTPYVRFERNDYSVPHRYVRTQLVAVASLETVRILDGNEVVATHPRSFDKGQQIEDPAHIEGLVEAKRKAKKHRGMDRLAHAAPHSRELLTKLAERGKSLGYATSRLLRLLDTYGAESLERALQEALAKGVIHVFGVHQALEREREERGRPPALPLPLPDDPRLRGGDVRPHSLGSYDTIGRRRSLSEDRDLSKGGDDEPLLPVAG